MSGPFARAREELTECLNLANEIVDNTLVVQLAAEKLRDKLRKLYSDTRVGDHLDQRRMSGIATAADRIMDFAKSARDSIQGGLDRLPGR